MRPEDWPSVSGIYAAGIAAGNATFEHAVPDYDAWSAAYAQDPRLVARDSQGKVIGWTALALVSHRAVYRGVGAVSIYVDPDFTGRRVGKALLLELTDASERAGFWTLEAGIFPENAASIALHESCGFEQVGTRRQIGKMIDGRWRDVLLFERRSAVLGR